jgi:apolipoprotein N-acyltransferase
MQRSTAQFSLWQKLEETWKLWVAAALAAVLLELPFPLAGPMPAWRSIFAWFGLVPLLWAVLSPVCRNAARPLRLGFLVAYLCGVLWYIGNCYWVRDTMMRYGDMPPMAPTLLLLAYSLVLGLYFGCFGLCLALVRRSTGSTSAALAAAPVLWTALEYAAAHITSVPWDQLGYSQVDNALINPLATWTGVYGISFLLVVGNALLAGGLLLERVPAKRWESPWRWGAAGGFFLVAGTAGLLVQSPRPVPTAIASLVQPNLDVAADNLWLGAEWKQHLAEFTRFAGTTCKNYIAGIPQTGAPQATPPCTSSQGNPALVVWPEAPAPFIEEDARFRQAMTELARTVHAPLVIGGIGTEFSAAENSTRDYNSAMVFASDGARVGRYDKIHLVPFGEYIPFKNLLFFARKLTGRVSEFSRGTERKVFQLDGHRYGVFLCYESVFADEVRHFARLGAEVLVNISDDGWYGDTSAPWQHLNMARMRAIENRRWILRDTNTGVTAVIDPYGRVRQSIARHQVDSLAAGFAFRNDLTFYTLHGDVFAWVCDILALGVVGWCLRTRIKML